MGLVRTTPPAAFITLADAKLHLRVDSDLIAEDSLITAYAAAAVDRVEGFLERAVLEQTWLLTLDQFPTLLCGGDGAFGWPLLRPGRPVYAALWAPASPMAVSRIRLPRPSLLSVDFIKYLDTTNTLVTLDPAAYVVDTSGFPGTVAPAYGTTWPASYPVPNAVQIQFAAGFSNDPALVPAAVKAACLLELGDLYARRETGPDVGDSARNLLEQYVCREATA